MSVLRTSTMILLLCFLLASCRQTKESPDRYIDRDVSPSEICGVWEISSETRHFIEIKDGRDSVLLGKPQRVTFFENGSCAVEMSMFIPPLPFEKTTHRYSYIDTSYAGTWEISSDRTYIHHQERSVPTVKITAAKEQYDNGARHISSKTVKLFIAETNDELVLWDFIGDPDYCHFRDFVSAGEEEKD